MKRTQLFGWDQEPVSDRRTGYFTEDMSGRDRTGVTTAPQVRNERGLVDEGMRLKREPANPRDQTLSPLAATWRNSQPGGITPDAVCTLYPRIANRLALCWSDPALTRRLLDELLSDNRGGRRGFPTLVRRELTSLAKAVR